MEIFLERNRRIFPPFSGKRSIFHFNHPDMGRYDMGPISRFFPHFSRNIFFRKNIGLYVVCSGRCFSVWPFFLFQLVGRFPHKNNFGKYTDMASHPKRRGLGIPPLFFIDWPVPSFFIFGNYNGWNILVGRRYMGHGHARTYFGIFYCPTIVCFFSDNNADYDVRGDRGFP